MTGNRCSNVVGFDDAPRRSGSSQPVLVVGAVFAARRLDGVLSTHVTPDGADATRRLSRSLTSSSFHAQLHAILLQGIAFAGFNVVDVPRLAEEVGLPVVVVTRRQPDLARIQRVLLEQVPGGRAKWRRIERAGPLHPVAGLFVHCAGITPGAAGTLIERHRVHGKLPEPIRVAHLIAGGVTTGHSRGRA